MTPAETVAFNAGIETVRRIARNAADRIETTDTRHIPAGFATAALRQLAHDAEQLLAPTPENTGEKQDRVPAPTEAPDATH